MKLVACRASWLLAVVLVFQWTLAWSPAAAQGTGAGPLLEKPQPTSELPGPGDKKEEAPTTCGPLISDSCIPISEHHASMQWLGALSFYTHAFSRNWRHDTAGGNLYTFNMPVKFTYGPTKDLETYIVVPFVRNWVTSANATGSTGENFASYSGVGDITTVAKYNFHP